MLLYLRNPQADDIYVTHLLTSEWRQ
jgi:hypothetical protein